MGEALVGLGRYTPFPLTSWWVRRAFWLPQREIVTVTTNVPGPRQPLYGMGRRLLEIIPYVPIATTVRTGISIFTYCGNVTFGITGDFAANPDLDVLRPRHRGRHIGAPEGRQAPPPVGSGQATASGQTTASGQAAASSSQTAGSSDSPVTARASVPAPAPARRHPRLGTG